MFGIFKILTAFLHDFFLTFSEFLPRCGGFSYWHNPRSVYLTPERILFQKFSNVQGAYTCIQIPFQNSTSKFGHKKVRK